MYYLGFMVFKMVLLSIFLLSCSSSDEASREGPSQTSSTTPTPSPFERDTTLWNKLNAQVQSYADKGQFSGTVLVAQNGIVMFEGGFGYAVVEEQIQNTVDTRFLIGSTTKSFTATTALRYVDRGLLDLKQPISAYLPNLKAPLGDVLTTDLLLRMQSGLPNHLARLTTIDSRQVTTADLMDIINTAELQYEPGTAYSYSNLNYTLVAAILEQISGLTYAEVLERELFDPLGMANSGSGVYDETIPDRALGYHVGSLIRTETNNLTYATGSGSAYSTIGDLHKWDQALYGDNYLSEHSKSLAFTGGTEEFGFYGYGFRVIDYKRGENISSPGTLVRHGGTMIGYLANVHRYLDDKLTVIILGNISQFPIRDLTSELKNIVLGIDFESGDGRVE